MLGTALLVLLLVLAVDRELGGLEGGGPYRIEIERPIRAVRAAREARHIVLGCSTSNWFAPALARAFGGDKRTVVDAHMSDCLQACSMAQARRIHVSGRHFETATMGVNSFEYCEAYRERRSMQEVELMPLADTFELVRVYAHSEDPLRYAGGWFMNHVSRVYGNTMWLQRHHRKRWFGNETPDSNWFAREPLPRRGGGAFRCDYVAADRDFGFAATRGALRALVQLADRVQLVLLPDQTYSGSSAEAQRGRELFRLEHEKLVAQFERVHLVNLLDESLTRSDLFRDRAHLNAKGVKRGASLLTERVRALQRDRQPEPQLPAELPRP